MPRIRRRARRSPLILAVTSGLSLATGCEAAQVAPPQPIAPITDARFAELVAELSGEGGYFDTDNLISNESSYLHVVGALERLGVSGGAYVGVGPDQNFSYIAAVRPRVAFIVDIRRDNVLEHLLFKALFELADTRVEYLSLLHGVPPPPVPADWRERGPDDLVDRVDGAAPSAEFAARAAALVDSTAASFSVPLSRDDRATIRRFHQAFVRAGPGLRFQSFGRPPRPYYPTFRQLVVARDADGRQSGFLADEEAYAFVRDLQRANLVVPVVGDLAGPHALRAVGGWIAERGLVVSAMYVSNVEFYLFGARTFDRFAENVATLPIDEHGVIVRSYFPNSGRVHPHAVRGAYSTQSLQTLRSFVAAARTGGYRSYWDLVTRDALDPRPGR